jgi:hypothetical protein
MVLSLSPGPARLEDAWHLSQHATMWRITDDFWDEWDLLRDMFDRVAAWAGVQKAGVYPDADMLPLGHIAVRSSERGLGDRWTRFTRPEQQTLMSLWCMARSPLMVGSELRDNDPWTLDLLTNREVLDIGRFSYGNHEILRDAEGAVWLARHPDGRGLYLGLFNWAECRRTMTVPLGALGIRPQRVTITDCWAHRTCSASLSEDLAAEVDAHGTIIWRISPETP